MKHAARHLLNDADRALLHDLVAAHGLTGAARLLDVSRGVVSSAAGGIGVMRGSKEIVSKALAAYRARDVFNGDSK